MNVTCINCGRPHELVNRVAKNKSQVGYFCDQKPVTRDKKGETIMVNHIEFIPFEGEVSEPLREVLTPAARKVIQGKSQLQFVMLYPDQDQIEARKVEEQIKALLATRDGIRSRMAQLEAEINQINDLTAKCGARLSELQTLQLPGMK